MLIMSSLSLSSFLPLLFNGVGVWVGLDRIKSMKRLLLIACSRRPSLSSIFLFSTFLFFTFLPSMHEHLRSSWSSRMFLSSFLAFFLYVSCRAM